MTRFRRIVLWTLAVLASLLILATIAGILVVRSDRFHQYVRQRIIQEAERATGGRVELSGYSLNWHNLTAQVQGVVLHGKESAAEPPLLKLDSATLTIPGSFRCWKRRSISRRCVWSGRKRISSSTRTDLIIFLDQGQRLRQSLVGRITESKGGYL